jgi:hypothetical protein
MDREQVSRLLSSTARSYQRLDLETSALLSREVLPGVPELTAVPVIARQAQQMVDEHNAAITAALIQAQAGPGVELAAITEPFARDCAHWDVAVGTILRTYQRGHQRLFQLWKERIEESVPDPEARAAVLALCAEVLLEYVTAGMELTVQVHSAEREVRLRGASWQQRDDVLAVLENRASGSQTELSRRLGHRLDRTQVGFVCWSGAAGGGRERAGLEAAAQDWAVAAAGLPALLVPVDSASAWGWISAPAGAQWLDAELPLPRDGFRIATGTGAAGVDGFRRSHLEALRAQAVAAAGSTGAVVTRFADVATLAVLTDDRDALRRYVADQLGDLAVSGEREHRLRSTVRNYLEGGANVRAVARDLNYHRNTIQQRLDLAARLRGRPLDDDRCGLALALQVAEHYGDAVLRQV